MSGSTGVALVTGVGRRAGLGAAIALGLAEDGWDLALSYWHPYDDRVGLGRSGSDVEDLAEEIRGRGRSVVLLEADLESPDRAAGLVDTAAAALGPVTGLVLSHCESVDSGLLDTTVESFDRHDAVNVRASWLLLAAFARQLPPSGGRVVALTSDAVAHNVPYGSSKGALDRLVLAAAHELADRRLLANVVNPGPVDTGWMDDEIRAEVVRMTPQQRLGTPTDTAHLVRFLLSEQGAWVNGQLLHSNGGVPAAVTRGLDRGGGIARVGVVLDRSCGTWTWWSSGPGRRGSRRRTTSGDAVSRLRAASWCSTPTPVRVAPGSTGGRR